VTNEELTLKLARVIKGKSFFSIHVPAFVLKIVLGEMSVEILKSATVNNYKIKELGFNFKFPTVDAALKDLAEG
jgi:NAD dependent epimerase/dehydratase family enzyme